ncbi:MAG: ACT domain-containing protein [Pseudomonadota bacterium]
MDGETLDGLVRAVTRAVSQRLGAQDASLVQLVVKEVVEAMGAETVQEGFVPLDNGDGTMTTALGSVVPKPNGDSFPSCAACVEQERNRNKSRAVVTATGCNRRGVVAKIASKIADAGGDIEDMSQTIVSGYFTMIMVVEVSGLTVPFSQFKEELQAAGAELEISTVVMHEDVLKSLQRV